MQVNEVFVTPFMCTWKNYLCGFLTRLWKKICESKIGSMLLILTDSTWKSHRFSLRLDPQHIKPDICEHSVTFPRGFPWVFKIQLVPPMLKNVFYSWGTHLLLLPNWDWCTVKHSVVLWILKFVDLPPCWVCLSWLKLVCSWCCCCLLGNPWQSSKEPWLGNTGQKHGQV